MITLKQILTSPQLTITEIQVLKEIEANKVYLKIPRLLEIETRKVNMINQFNLIIQ